MEEKEKEEEVVGDGGVDCQTQTLIDGDGTSCVESCVTVKIQDDRSAAVPGKTDSERRHRGQDTLWRRSKISPRSAKSYSHLHSGVLMESEGVLPRCCVP